MEFTKQQLSLFADFYNASQEIEKDFEELEILNKQRFSIEEKIKQTTQKIQVRNTIITGILKGILLEKENTPLLKAETKNLLYTGGADMKYRGITIIKNKSCNTWYARPKIDGKQIYISAKTQKLCYDKVKAILDKKAKCDVKTSTEKNTKTITTFIEWYKKWLSLFKKDVKQGTIKNYNTCLNHIKEIHNIKINEITAITIQELLNKIDGQRTKQKIYEFLKMLLEKAYINEIIAKNPLNIIDKPKHKKKNGNALSNEDEKILEEKFKEDGRDVFLVCLYQGLRKGEVLALETSDIDFDKNTISINKSLDYKNIVGTTKNESSKRIIPLFEKTKQILLKYKNTKGRIFPINYNRLEKYFNKYKSLFKEHYTIHSLRHTFITRCQELGVQLHIIQKWVGHTNGSAVTNQVYTHTRTNAEAENINILNNFYST